MNVREWFARAQSEGFAIGAFNVDNLDIMRAIFVAGQRKKSPVMLEFSGGEVGYFGLKNIINMANSAREEYGIPILLNLDHAKKIEDCMEAIDYTPGVDELHIGSEESGVAFDDVHFDGSELDILENVESTKKIVAAAHAKNLLVEGEIDRIAGSSEAHREDLDIETIKKSYTECDKAKKFVEETGVDIFASFFGNVHGTFPNQPDLDMKLIGEIREALPETFLSMHGGSGIPAQQVKEAIKVGKIVKINVNTEIRQAFMDALKEELGENPDEMAYYKLTGDIVNAVAAVVEAKIEVFGSAGKA